MKEIKSHHELTEHINDLDKSIYSFWKSIIDNPDGFCDWIETVDISISNWKLYKEWISDTFSQEYTKE